MLLQILDNKAIEEWRPLGGGLRTLMVFEPGETILEHALDFRCCICHLTVLWVAYQKFSLCQPVNPRLDQKDFWRSAYDAPRDPNESLYYANVRLL